MGISIAVLVLLCAVTVQAGQAAGKNGNDVNTGAEAGTGKGRSAVKSLQDAENKQSGDAGEIEDNRQSGDAAETKDSKQSGDAAGMKDSEQADDYNEKKEDKEQTGEDSGKTETDGQEKGDGEKEPDSAEGEGNEGGDGETQKPAIKPAEEMLMPEIQYPETDGKNGYYKSCPDIRIIHRESGAVTRYELTAANGSKKQGVLELEEGKTEAAINLPGECFHDGENVLRVWMERKETGAPDKDDAPEKGDTSEKSDTPEKNDTPEKDDTSEKNDAPEKDDTSEKKDTSEKGDSPEADDPSEENGLPGERIVFSSEIRFLIDTRAPDKVRFFYNRSVDKNRILVNEALEITVKSGDAGSGVDAICYQAGDGVSGTLSGGSGTIVLNPGFHGKIRAYAVDKAGNQSEPCASETILCENISPEIYIQTEGGGESWHSGPVKVHVDVADSGLSAGIRSLKCYSAGMPVVQEENLSDAGVVHMQADFTVDASSEGGNGIPVIAEAVDWAGNYHTENILLYIDNAAPVIQSDGIHDKMITGEALRGKIRFREENILAQRKLEIWKTESDGTRKLQEKKEEGQETPSDSGEAGWDVSLEEDGIYEICAAAKDLAGHKSEQRYQVIVDKTNPVIRYVDQMQGAYVPYFQWNYGKEEVVRDDNEYSYEIRLDGRFYNTGTRVEDEGARMLQVEAVDAAGNKSTAEAIFQIDHTPPRIRIYDVENGTSYEEAAAVSISVDGKGEYLKGVHVNSEKKKLDAGCQIYQQTFEEPGDYLIRVLAEDLAGNQGNEQVTFRIEARKRMAKGMWKPVTKIIKNESAAASHAAEDKDEENENGAAGIYLVICLAAAGAAFGFRQWRIRR